MTAIYPNTELHIAGIWRGAEAGETLDVINPATGEPIGQVAHARKADLDAALAGADEGFKAWKQVAAFERYKFMRKAAELVRERAEEIATMMTMEQGKPIAEAKAETLSGADIIDWFAEEARRTYGRVIPARMNGVQQVVVKEPVGPVAAFTPWNFPIAIPAWKIAPALAYGNTIVFKPADLVPGCAWALADILVRAGLPQGVFNLVMGRGSVVGQVMLDSPDIDALSFTGSVSTGKRVAEFSAKHMRKFQLEMGGKNPLIVLDDANLKTAVECAVNGAFFQTGQRCTASSRLVVAAGIHDSFVDALTDRMKGLVVDDALKDGTHVGPVVDQSQLDQDESYIEIGRDEGAKLHWGGERLNRATSGFYLQPALFTGTTPDMRINREEIFGPVASVIKVKDYDEAVTVANDTFFGLSSGICTSSLKYASDFRRNSEAGMVMVNLPTAGVDYHVPFGGRKGSSYGSREQGHYAAEFYTSVKTAYTLP